MDTGPSLTLTLAVNSSPLTDSKVAPGMHGAMDSTSNKVFHAVLISAGTVKEFCKSTKPPNNATRAVLEPGTRFAFADLK
jgi:hypothetical protein